MSGNPPSPPPSPTDPGPASPSYRSRTPTYDGKSPMAREREQANRGDEYDPAEPQIKPERSRDAGDNHTFDFKGPRHHPSNLMDIPRYVITKCVKCQMCGHDVELAHMVPAFLCRRKGDAPIPADLDRTKHPWFWTQAFCAKCRYAFPIKVFVPVRLFESCTMAAYPPEQTADSTKYSNGLSCRRPFELDRTEAEAGELQPRWNRAFYDRRREYEDRSKSLRGDDRYSRRDHRARSRSPRRDHRRQPPPSMHDSYHYYTNGAYQQPSSSSSSSNHQPYSQQNQYPQNQYPQDKYPQDKYPVDQYPQDQYPQDQYHQGSSTAYYGNYYNNQRAPPQHDPNSKMPSQSYSNYVPKQNEPIPAPKS